MLKVTLVKSLIGGEPRNVRTVHALGLRKIGQTNTFEDTPAIRGMIHHAKHLLKVEVLEDGEIRRRRVIRAEKAPAPEAKPKAVKPKKEAAAESAEAPKPKRTTKKKSEETE